MSITEAPTFRIDVGLHDMLKDNHNHRDIEDSVGPVEGVLPEPVYPQHPDSSVRWPTERAYNGFKRLRTWKGLGAPYFQSRLMPWDLRPLIAYLFTEWKCNLDCHYCWSYDNTIKGMKEPVAKRSIGPAATGTSEPRHCETRRGQDHLRAQHRRFVARLRSRGRARAGGFRVRGS